MREERASVWEGSSSGVMGMDIQMKSWSKITKQEPFLNFKKSMNGNTAAAGGEHHMFPTAYQGLFQNQWRLEKRGVISIVKMSWKVPGGTHL